MGKPTTFQKRQKEWCLVYVDKYVLRVGMWNTINKIMEKTPAYQRTSYRMLHISVCKDLIFVWPASTHAQ